MPRGQLTPFPAGYLPLKTSWGWTAIRVRLDELDMPVGLDTPRTRDGRHVAFWRRRKDVAEAIDGMVLLAENERLMKEVQRLRDDLARAGAGALVGVS